MITLDTETCGLYGMPVLLQYAEDEGDVILYDLWKQPIHKTLRLIEWICTQDICGFNLAFDWFMIIKFYTTILRYHDHNAIPEDIIEALAQLEKGAWEGPCLKPKRACDLLLHARKGPYQSLMARKDIKIKRVPTILAKPLADKLEELIEIDGIYFSRRKDKYAPIWSVQDTDSPDFKHVCLKFAASSGLKVLAEHVLKIQPDEILKFADIEVPRKLRPKEAGWAPYALALSTPKANWKVYKKGKLVGYAWPRMIRHHIRHWHYNELARKYAGDDVKYTYGLWKKWDRPEPGDNDSELACMVACVRWHGLAIDTSMLKAERNAANARKGAAPIDPKKAKDYIGRCMDDTEKLDFTSTKKVKLEAIQKFKCDCDPEFGGPKPCPRCSDSGNHPAAVRAKEVLDARKAKKEEVDLTKLIQAERFYASFAVIGTLSSRMAGTDGLNAQGINRRTEVRSCFQFADPGYILCGGDFDAFEVVLADAAYDDKDLRDAITKIVPCAICDCTGRVKLKKKGKPIPDDLENQYCEDCGGKGKTTQKIHALFAMEMFPGNSYDDIMRSKGTARDMYSLGKNGVFTMIYGGDFNTLINKYGVDPEVARKAEEGFVRRFPGIKRARAKIFDMFCSMRQPAGEGTRVIWAEPADYIESLFGFRRYFTLENQICKALFNLGANVPKPWKDIRVTCSRKREKIQVVGGALCSALYGAAFAIQSRNMRAAANHVIQSSGATITKVIQRKLWDLQPYGVHDWKLYGINVHDELMVCAREEFQEAIGKIIVDNVESFRPRVPLIKFEFQRNMKSWASK